MSKSDIPNATEKNLSTLTTGTRHITEEVDFKPYLEAAIVASQRVRSIIYILIIALIAIFAAYRNTAQPDWLDSRLQQLQMAYSCMQEKQNTPDCTKAVEYAKGFMYQSLNGSPASSSSAKYDIQKIILNNNPSPTDLSEEGRELRYQIDMLMKQRTENLSVRFPVLGLVMDMNDLGWVSGITLLVLMYIFLLALAREEDNLIRAKGKAEQSGNKDNLELLLMAHVFSAPSKAKTGTNKAFYLFFVIPFLLQFLIIYTDIFTAASQEAGSALMGPWLYWMQIASELLFLFGIGWLSLRNAKQWKRIDNGLNRIRQAYEQWEKSDDG
jgi:hypothetical protein